MFLSSWVPGVWPWLVTYLQYLTLLPTRDMPSTSGDNYYSYGMGVLTKTWKKAKYTWIRPYLEKVQLITCCKSPTFYIASDLSRHSLSNTTVFTSMFSVHSMHSQLSKSSVPQNTKVWATKGGSRNAPQISQIRQFKWKLKCLLKSCKRTASAFRLFEEHSVAS